MGGPLSFLVNKNVGASPGSAPFGKVETCFAACDAIIQAAGSSTAAKNAGPAR
jgi:hypothetical protein